MYEIKHTGLFLISHQNSRIGRGAFKDEFKKTYLSAIPEKATRKGEETGHLL